MLLFWELWVVRQEVAEEEEDERDDDDSIGLEEDEDDEEQTSWIASLSRFRSPGTKPRDLSAMSLLSIARMILRSFQPCSSNFFA